MGRRQEDESVYDGVQESPLAENPFIRVSWHGMGCPYDHSSDDSRGGVKRNAVMTASTWMFLVYGAIPLVVFPMEKLLLKLKVPKVLGIFLFLFLFYLAEYAWGFFFHTFEVEPWNYNWYTPKRWNPKSGYISFHPVILFCWLIFVLLGRKLDQVLRIIFA